MVSTFLLVFPWLWRTSVLADIVFNCSKQEIFPCMAVLQTSELACTEEALQRRFPELYDVSGGDTWPGRPPDFRALYYEEQAVSLGGLPGFFYPGVRLEFGIPTSGDWHSNVKGFEVLMHKANGVMCMVFDVSEVTWSQDSLQGRLEQDLFPLSGDTRYWIQISSLPRPPPPHPPQTDTTYVITGEYQRYGGFGAYQPAHWSARISYMVYHVGSDRVLELSFSQPPYDFRFREFNVVLLHVDHIHVRAATIQQFTFNFTDVLPGQYTLSVNPVDEFFSQPGKCLCHRDNGLCTNCLTTVTELFTIL